VRKTFYASFTTFTQLKSVWYITWSEDRSVLIKELLRKRVSREVTSWDRFGGDLVNPAVGDIGQGAAIAEWKVAEAPRHLHAEVVLHTAPRVVMLHAGRQPTVEASTVHLCIKESETLIPVLLGQLYITTRVRK
jgi:hypothetical protein